MAIENAFNGPKETRRLSSKNVAAAAEQTNAALAEGRRLFNFPIGIADAIIDCLETAGEAEPRWIVEVQVVTDTDVTVLVRDPLSRFTPKE